jgi:Ulp1 protease family, C-terminal catalytic domain
MDTNQLNYIFKVDKTTKAYYGGTYASDEILEIVENTKFNGKMKFFVSNTKPSEHEGEHWVLLFFNGSDEPPIFFDSFGRNIPKFKKYDIKKSFDFMISETTDEKRYEYNPFFFQAEDSIVCGLYCVFFAHYLSLDVPFNEILDRFDQNDKKTNDALIYEWGTRNFADAFVICDKNVKKPKQICKKRIACAFC